MSSDSHRFASQSVLPTERVRPARSPKLRVADAMAVTDHGQHGRRPFWQRSGLEIVVLRSQGTSIWFSGTLAVKLSDRHAASVAYDPALQRHNNDTSGLCSTQGGSNPGGRTRKIHGLQRCKPFHLCIGLESGFR